MAERTVDDRPLGATAPGLAARWLTRFFALPTERIATAWLETLALSAIAITAGWITDPSDPLQTSASFPWLWFAPVLAALRYGAIAGVASAALLIVAWYAFALVGIGGTFPRLQFTGGIVLALVCAEFSSRWRNGVSRSRALNRYLEERIERVTKRLHLLQVSHDRLEQELLARPATMRDALARWKRVVLESDGVGPLPAAEAFLQFLAQQCQLEAAAIYAAAGADASPTLSVVARIGAVPGLDADDPLLAYALEHRALAHLQSDGIDERVPTRHLVVAPLITSDGQLLGVLAVSRMPFFALNHDTLQLVAVLVGVYADSIAYGPAVRAILSVVPACPEPFADELARLLRIEREHAIDSQIVVFRFGGHERALEARHFVERNRRAPDVGWAPLVAAAGSTQARAAFVNLLPIAGPATVAGYLARIETGLRERLGADFGALAIETTVIALASGDAVDRLAARLYGSLLAAQQEAGD